MNRQQVSMAQIHVQETRSEYINAPETYAEDRAFMNRMKKINFRDMQKDELQKIWKIALRGLDVRDKVEREISTITDELHTRKENGTLNCAYKLGWALEENMHRLKGLR